jgi:hypothetical protein
MVIILVDDIDMVRRSQEGAMVKQSGCQRKLSDCKYRLGGPNRVQHQGERPSVGGGRRLREEHRMDQKGRCPPGTTIGSM